MNAALGDSISSVLVWRPSQEVAIVERRPCWRRFAPPRAIFRWFCGGGQLTPVLPTAEWMTLRSDGSSVYALVVVRCDYIRIIDSVIVAALLLWYSWPVGLAYTSRHGNDHTFQKRRKSHEESIYSTLTSFVEYCVRGSTWVLHTHARLGAVSTTGGRRRLSLV